MVFGVISGPGEESVPHAFAVLNLYVWYIEDWAIRVLPVDADGSCFFSSITIALNESLHAWMHNKKIKKILKQHWHIFLDLGLESPDYFTPTFVRYITSVSIDQNDLVAYNGIATADNVYE